MFRLPLLRGSEQGQANMSIAPTTTTEYIWFGTRAVKFEAGGNTGPQFEVLDDASDFATRTLSTGTVDFTGSEWQQFLAFSGTADEMAALGINLSDGVDTATAGQVNTSGDLRVGEGVEAHNIADISGGGRLVDTSSTLDDVDDPIAITGLGKGNASKLDSASMDAADTGNRVIFSNDLGFGLINRSGFDSGGTANALRLNDGDAINFEIKQGKELSEASFTVKVLGGVGFSTEVIIDSDGATIRDTNGDTEQGGFVQDASSGELSLGMLAHGTKVTINYVNETIWFNGAVQFAGDLGGIVAFFDAFQAGGSKNLTIGSALGNQVGWSADNLVLATDVPGPDPIPDAALPDPFTGTGDPTDTAGPGATTEVVFDPTGGGAANVVTGTAEGDSISAGNNADTVYGYGGGDTINGDAVADQLFGQTDGDVINGNAGADTLYGGSGADSLNGGADDDLLIGGYGADTLNGDAGADTFRFLSANDTNDVLTGYAQAEDTIDLAALYAGTLAFNATASASFAGAYSVSWFNDAGNTVVIAELDGDISTAEFMLTIQGQTLTMAAGNFIL